MKKDSTKSSGNEAIEKAEERAKVTAGKNISPLTGVPTEKETANLRFGPEIDDLLLGLLPLVGVWRGEGKGKNLVTDQEFTFGQQIIVSHYGQATLQWNSQIWSSEDKKLIYQELGFWTVNNANKETESLDLCLATNQGLVEIFNGKALTPTSWELTAKAIVGVENSTPHRGGKRLYGIMPNGNLGYVEEQATTPEKWLPVFSAELTRYIG